MRSRVVLVRGPRSAAAAGGGCCSGDVRPFDPGGSSHCHAPPDDEVGAVYRALRAALPGCRILTHCGGGKYNNQLKKAYASGARCALILEGDEAQEVIKFKPLDNSGEDKSLPLNEVKTWLQKFFN